MHKILVTGFEPFGGDDENPTELLARDLDGMNFGEYVVVGRVLPVSVKRTGKILEEILKEVKPIIAIHFGLAPGASYISVERVAINLVDMGMPDNNGFKAQDLVIEEDAPLAYFSTLPTRRIVEKLIQIGIPARLSYSAGTFLCNYVLFKSLHHRARYGYPKVSGFIHVPYLPRQVVKKHGFRGLGIPSMCFENIKRAAMVAIETSVKWLEEGDGAEIDLFDNLRP